MKRRYTLPVLAMAALVINSIALLAQETTVTVQVKEDGKVVKDTTYTYDDVDEATHAVQMLGILSGHGHGEMEYIHKTKCDGDHSKTMVFISEDGKKTEIKELHGDSVVWIAKGEHDGENVKVMKYHMESDDHPHGKHVVVVKSDDGETVDILLDEGEEGGDCIKKKQVIVVKKKPPKKESKKE